jgi:DNA-binding MarR family transcriptional regulator
MARSAKPRKPEESSSSSESVGRFSYQGLDRVMHEKARLGILASLAANDRGILFNDLRQLCSLTDGNLSRHLRVLSEAGLVEIWKGSTGSRPQTMYRLTSEGRQRFADYIGVLEKIVADAQSQAKPETDQPRFSGGWSPA